MAIALGVCVAASVARAEPPRCKPPRILHRDACLYVEEVEKLQAAARAKRPKPAKPVVQPAVPTPTSGVSEPGSTVPPKPVEVVVPVVSSSRAPSLASADEIAAIGLRWVGFAEGVFPMGSAWGDPDEKPVRNVRLPAYRMSVSEVTVAQYGACVAAGWCDDDLIRGEQWADHPYEESRFCNAGQPERGAHPLNCVSWWQAQAFCEWVGGRLPTEAEWERAATGGARMYPWGDAPPTCSHAVMNNGDDGCGAGTTASVCERPTGRTPEGLCDMAGNVWEWVGDWYSAGYYAEGVSDDPDGPAFGGARVRRGGSFRDQATDLRATNRWSLGGVYRSANLGFRCAAD